MAESAKLDELSAQIEKLKKNISGVESNVSKKEKCFPTTTVVAIAAPFVAGLGLYMIQPSFVQKQEGGKYVRDSKKMLLWTLGLSMVVWIALFLFTYCRGGAKPHTVCLA
jgi:uncharacterized membrane-anchored protein